MKRRRACDREVAPADEVERLRAEREKLRAAMRKIIAIFPEGKAKSPIARSAGPLYLADNSGLYHTGKTEAVLVAAGIDLDGFDEPLDASDWVPSAKEDLERKREAVERLIDRWVADGRPGTLPESVNMTIAQLWDYHDSGEIPADWEPPADAFEGEQP